ncbi:TlpA family protein disulfide reductase [Streptomyces sp. NPDC056039]|uniref:TlpA family protein disulfide reductase n=1 Tax=Streptomyces sp. NPDC056039 TaxID=3345687 RepID=UPI0035E2101E
MSFSHAPRAAMLTGLVAAGVLTLSSCGNGGTSGGGGDTNYIQGSGGIGVVAKGERQRPNDLKGESLQGAALDVADLKGKVVVMNVWGSWCPPCRAEAPNFARVAKDMKSKGVEFVGIDTRDTSKQAALAFEKDYEIDYPSFYDPSGKLIVNGFPKGSLNPQTIPSTIVLDRDGKIAARALKALGESDLRKMIAPVIAEK